MTTTAGTPRTADRPAPGPPPTDPSDARSQGYVTGVEGMRAAAALLVVAVHTSFTVGLTTRPGAAGTYIARGEVSVGIFFLVSGFLLYRPFAAAHLSGAPRPPTAPYLVRRALRILPLYWTALAVVLAFEPAARPRDALGWVLLPAFGQVYRDTDVFLGLTQAWTLDVEVAFYLMLPVWAWAVGRLARARRSRVRTELVALAGLYAFSVLLRYVLELTNPVPWKVWHGFLPVWTDLLSLGMTLGVLSAHWRRTGREPAWLSARGVAEACWLAAGGLFLVLSTCLGLGRDPLYDRHPGQALAEELLWGAIGLLLMLPAVFGRGGPVRWLVSSRPVALAGVLSYGLYVWHQLVIDQLLSRGAWHAFREPFWPSYVTVLAIGLAAAIVTHVLVEKPGIALGRRLARRLRPAPAAPRPVPPAPPAPAASGGQVADVDRGPGEQPAT